VEATPDVALVPMGVAAEAACVGLAARLRRSGLVVDMGFRGNMKKRLARANDVGAEYAIILGDNELAEGKALLRNLRNGQQTLQPLEHFGKMPLTLMDGLELGKSSEATRYIAGLLKDLKMDPE